MGHFGELPYRPTSVQAYSRFYVNLFYFTGRRGGGGGGDEGLPSLKKPPDPGGAQKCFIRGGSGLALLFTISNRKGAPFK